MRPLSQVGPNPTFSRSRSSTIYHRSNTHLLIEENMNYFSINHNLSYNMAHFSSIQTFHVMYNWFIHHPLEVLLIKHLIWASTKPSMTVSISLRWHSSFNERSDFSKVIRCKIQSIFNDTPNPMIMIQLKVRPIWVNTGGCMFKMFHNFIKWAQSALGKFHVLNTWPYRYALAYSSTGLFALLKSGLHPKWSNWKVFKLSLLVSTGFDKNG